MDREKLIMDNHNLIYSFIQKNNLELEEYYDVLAIGLIKAADKFDNSYGNTFSTFAYKVMKNEYLMYRIKRNRDSLAHSISLNGYTDDDVPLIEILQKDYEDVFDIKLPKQLTSEERELLIYRLCGFTNKEIKKITGMYPAKIASTMAMIREKWGSEYGEANEKFNR